jgi:hypothetical protein
MLTGQEGFGNIEMSMPARHAKPQEKEPINDLTGTRRRKKG